MPAMLISTQGLVLHTTQYSESSVIAHIFTRELGRRSYILKGVRNAKSRVKQSILQPLSHVDLVVYEKSQHDSLNYVKEISPISNFGSSNISCDAVASALLFFMDEVLYRSLRENEPNPSMFDYVVSEIQSLGQEPYAATPILFLIRIARFLGIEPFDNHSIHEPLFNLKEGRFLAKPTRKDMFAFANYDYFLSDSASTQLHYYLEASHNNVQIPPRLSLQQRTELINVLLEYYHLHLPDFSNFKSHQVLHTVLQ